MDPQLLAALLSRTIPGQPGYDPKYGGIGGSQYDPSAQDVPAAAPEEEEITVQDKGWKSKYNTQIFGGDFAPGKKWSNILGAIGDSLLIGSGADPIYRKHLEQLRQSEAAEGFTQDPRHAAERLNFVTPGAGEKMWDSAQDNERLNAAAQQQAANTASIIQARKELSDKNFDERQAAFMGAANKDTWPKIRNKIIADYAARGRELPVELPEDYDAAKIALTQRYGIDPDKQATIDGTADYRRRMLGYRYAAEEGRNDRAEKTLSVRQSEGEATRRARAEEAARRRQWDLDHPKGKGGRRAGSATPVQGSVGVSAPKTVKFGRDANGRPYVIK